MIKKFNDYNRRKVFLGGTCNESKWRDELIDLLKIDYFNPVVDDWTDDAYQEELRQREICSDLLYVITPRMSGVYSIAEAVDDSNKRPEKTIFAIGLDFDDDGELMTFDKAQMKSLIAVGKMIENNGGKFFNCNMEIVADYLNE